MQLTCPTCQSIDVSNVYSGDDLEEDISCGIKIVKYECECESCGNEFECTIHYAIADIQY